MMNKKGMLIVMSAPSGCGKDTIFKELKKIRDDVVESVSATTRAPRENEVDGVNYFFKSTEEFEKMIEDDLLLEYASYNDCYYGTPVAGVNQAINDGKICFLIIEVNGAKNIIAKYNDAVSIFVMPPSLDVLKQRLVNRQTNDLSDIDNRLKIAEKEIKNANIYKYNVINDDLSVAVNEINEIINNELEARNK